MVRAVYNPNYFHFDSLLPYLSLAWLNIVFKLEYHSRWCLQDRCKLPWHGGDQQNAVHSWSGEVSAPHMYLFTHEHTHTAQHWHIVSHFFFSSVTVFYAECLELTSLSRKEQFCLNCMCRLCFFAESTDSKMNKHLLSCL